MYPRRSQSATVASNTKEATIEIKPGQSLFLNARATVSFDYSRDYSLLGLVFAPDHVRYLINDHDASVGHRSPQCWHHVELPPQSPLRPIIQTLESLNDHNSNFAPDGLRLFQTLLSVGHQLLQTSQENATHEDTTSKARMTYSLIRSYVEENCCSPIDRVQTAEALGIHPGHISRLFKTFADESFTTYLNRMRIQASIPHLLQGENSIKCIAATCGFNDSLSYIRHFKATEGTTPGAYRNQTQLRNVERQRSR